MHAIFWPIGYCDVIISAPELKNIFFIDDVIFFFVQSITGDRFSRKFLYVVADTILYKKYDIHFLNDVIIVKFSIKGDNS